MYHHIQININIINKRNKHLNSLMSTITLSDGNVMPMVGFGTYLCSDEDAKRSVTAALRAGYRHFDSAEYYANERGVGEAVRASSVPRSEIYVTSKLAPGGFGTPFKTYETTIQSFNESFDRLDVDYIDLYLIHHAFAKMERLDQWRALVDLRKSGRVRSIGVSNWGISHLDEIRAAGLPMPTVNQIELHPLATQTELIAYMAAHCIAPVAYSSLAPLPQWREDTPDKGSSKDGAGHAQSVISDIAANHAVSPARVLLRWGVQHGYPVLPKSTNEDRIKSNFDLFSFELTEADMQALDDLNQNKVFAWPSVNPLLCD